MNHLKIILNLSFFGVLWFGVDRQLRPQRYRRRGAGREPLRFFRDARHEPEKDGKKMAMVWFNGFLWDFYGIFMACLMGFYGIFNGIFDGMYPLILFCLVVWNMKIIGKPTGKWWLIGIYIDIVIWLICLVNIMVWFNGILMGFLMGCTLWYIILVGGFSGTWLDDFPIQLGI